MKNHQYSMQQVSSELIHKVNNYKCSNDCISPVFGFSRLWMFLLISTNIGIHKSVIKFQLNDNLNNEKMASENEERLSLFLYRLHLENSGYISIMAAINLGSLIEMFIRKYGFMSSRSAVYSFLFIKNYIISKITHLISYGSLYHNDSLMKGIIFNFVSRYSSSFIFFNLKAASLLAALLHTNLTVICIPEDSSPLCCDVTQNLLGMAPT
ncbi:hypothetical protein Xenpb_02226 [Xenorhabdus sp. PB62.4]|nr:hypothetical protein [Xenorhabdus sp. PB62.4]